MKIDISTLISVHTGTTSSNALRAEYISLSWLPCYALSLLDHATALDADTYRVVLWVESGTPFWCANILVSSKSNGQGSHARPQQLYLSSRETDLTFPL